MVLSKNGFVISLGDQGSRKPGSNDPSVSSVSSCSIIYLKRIEQEQAEEAEEAASFLQPEYSLLDI